MTTLLQDSPKFKIGDILKFPLGKEAEVIKVTEEYVILDVPDSDPIKLLLTDFGTFQNKD